MSTQDKALSGEVALVTGAGGGIGSAIAERLARSGSAVALLGRSQSTIEATQSTIEELGVPCIGLTADVRDRHELETALETIEAELGQIDLLVNNAGANTTFGPTWEIDPEQWWSDMRTNLFGPLLLAHLVLPSMISRRKGRIVNIASGSGNRASPNNSAYACSKLGLVRLTDSLAAEVQPFDISVFALSPGAVSSGMPARILQTPLGRKYIGEVISSLQFVEPTLAADAVAFLATGAGDALTGRFFHVLDDVPALAKRAQEIEDGDFYQVRLQVPD